LPFDEVSIVKVFNKIKQSKFKFPIDISKAAIDLIARMLHPNSIRRIKIPEIYCHEWFNEVIPF